MQDRYAGDIGDFSKLGLLRWLAVAEGEAPLRLGLLWWRMPDEGHNADGRHVQYLSGASPNTQLLCACDPELARALTRVVEGERSVRGLQASGALPADTLYFDEALSFGGVRRVQRVEHRRAWLDRGIAAIEDAQLVCVDPDNGLEIASCGLQANKGPKFIGYDELRRVADCGRSVVVYQHVDRSGPLAGQIERRRDAMMQRLGLDERPLAVVFRRTSVRVYFVIPQRSHAERIGGRVRELVAGAWGQHFGLA